MKCSPVSIAVKLDTWLQSAQWLKTLRWALETATNVDPLSTQLKIVMAEQQVMKVSKLQTIFCFSSVVIVFINILIYRKFVYFECNELS